MWKEFKEFAVKGNVVDIAVGIIIGAAFGTVVTALVEGILMPPLGLLLGGVDVTNIFSVLQQGSPPGPYASLEGAESAGAVTLNWGVFVNSVISFLVVAFAVFLLVKRINALKREGAAEATDGKAAPALTTDQHLLTEIRDLLKVDR